MNQSILRKFAALALLPSLLIGADANAGSPPPPPWKPTNELRIYFAYNNDLIDRNYIGARCARYSWFLCTPQGRAQASVDYLNAVLRASGANVKAVVAGASAGKTNIRHWDAVGHPGLEALRQKHGAHMLMVVNSDRSPAGVRGGTGLGSANRISAIGWFVAGFDNQEKHIFAHEVAHALGAMHDWSDNYTLTKPVVPHAVGWKTNSHNTLMLFGPGTTLDRFSDHEQWYGAPDRSVARWLREKYGRYGR